MLLSSCTSLILCQKSAFDFSEMYWRLINSETQIALLNFFSWNINLNLPWPYRFQKASNIRFFDHDASFADPVGGKFAAANQPVKFVLFTT